MTTRDVSKTKTNSSTATDEAKPASQNTSTAVFAPIIKALMGCEEYVQGIKNGWVPANQEQQTLLERFYVYKDELKAFGPEELKAWARDTAEELNGVLADHGYNIRLEPWPTGDGFGVIAIMDALAKWIDPGARYDIHCKSDGQVYPGVELKKSAYEFISHAHQHPLLAIQAQNNYEVWMTVADEPLSGIDLVCKIQDIRDNGLKMKAENAHGYFPMINLDHQTDIEWLLGIHAIGNDTGKPVIITQALQQTKFRMNEFGAHAQSAVALGVSRGISRNPIIHIDRPFYLWILKDLGQDKPALRNIPVFAGYLDTDCWNDPNQIG